MSNLARFKIPEQNAEAYITAVLQTVERVDRKKPRANRPTKAGYIWVDDPSTKNGGYFRKAPTKKAAEATSAAGSGAMGKAAVGVLAGLATGAAVAAVANRWRKPEGVSRTVEIVRKVADTQAADAANALRAKAEQIAKRNGGLAIAATAIGATATGASIFYARKQSQQRQATEEQLRQRESDLSQASTRQKELQGQLRQRETDLSEAQSRQQELEGSLQKTKGELGQLKSRQKGSESELATTQEQARSLEADLTQARTQMESMEAAHQEQIASLTKTHESTLAKTQADLEKTHAKKLSELEKAHKTNLKAAESKSAEEAKKVRQKFEQDLKKAQDDAKQEVERERTRANQELEQRKAELQKDFSSNLGQELEKRTAEITERVNREALDRIVREREAALKTVADQVRDATQPKARRAGDLAYNDKDGIALAASVRQGLDLNVVSPANQKTRVANAVKKLVAQRYEERIRDLAVSFRDRAKEIQNYGGDKPAQTPKAQENVQRIRWEAMQQALMSQARREAALEEEIDNIRKSYTEKHNEALSEMQSAASNRGSYEIDMAEAFDKRSKKLNQQMQKDITSAIADIFKQIKLDSLELKPAAYRQAFQGCLSRI